MKCVKELGQWDFSSVSIFPGDGSLVNKHSLIFEKELPEICVCKSLKTTLSNLIVKRNYGEELLKSSFVKCPVKLCLEKQDSFKISEVLTEAVLLLTDEWKMLPTTVSGRHFSLLKAMMRIREYKEAIEFQNSLKKDENLLLLGVSNVAQKWFLRLPSIYENVSFWNEIYLFRHNQFKYLQNEFLKNTEVKTAKCALSLLYLGLFGNNHCIVQIAELYRKHGMPNLCVTQLMRIKSTHIDLNTFEQCIRAFLDEVNCIDESEREANLLQIAYDFTETADLKLLLPEDSIQMRSIKKDLALAIATYKLNDPVENLHDLSMLDALALQLERSFINSNDHLFGAEASKLMLKGCKSKSKIDSMHSISRLLLMLSLEDKLGKVVAEYSDYIPESHWLPWLPQLLSILSHSKGALYSLIKRIGEKYPQSLYIHLQSTISSGNSEMELIKSAWHKKLLNDLKNSYPCLCSILSRIFNELMEMNKNKCQSILRILKTGLDKVYEASFQCLKSGSDINDSSEIWRFLITQLDSPESTCESPDFEKMKRDFFERYGRGDGLNSMLTELLKWINYYSDKIFKEQRLNSWAKMDNNFLLRFHLYQYEVEMFSDNLIQPKTSRVGISQFLPAVELIKKYNDVAWKFYVKGDDGNVYPFTCISQPFIKNIRKESNVSRFLSFLNPILMDRRETLKYFLKIYVPDIVTIASDVHIVCDDESSISFTDIYKQHATEVEADDLLRQYYKLVIFGNEDQLDETIVYDNALFMLDIFKVIQKNLVSETILKDWARAVYQSTADYIEFRTQFAKDIALSGFLKKAFCLTSQKPDKIFVHQDKGNITNFGYQFNNTFSGLSDSPEWVPFRLTPNISNFLTPAGVKGIFTPIMQAIASCFRKHEKVIEHLLIVFWLDDILQDQTEEKRGDNYVKSMIENANWISQSIRVLSDCKQLRYQVESAEDPKNLCLMNPNYFPWL